MDALPGVVSVWLGSMFVYSASLKFAHYHRARGALMAYRVLPDRLALAGGALLPWLEVLTGVLLLFSLLPPAGPLMAAILGAGFTYGSARVLGRGASVPCGCTASGSEPVSRTTLFRAVAIVVSAVALLALSAGPIPLVASIAVGAIAILPFVPVMQRARRSHRGPAPLSRLQAEVSSAELARLGAILGSPPAGKSAPA